MPNQCHCSGGTRRILAALTEGFFFKIWCSLLSESQGEEWDADSHRLHLYIYVHVLANAKSQSFAIPQVKLTSHISLMYGLM